jgi:hypothetical protein
MLPTGQEAAHQKVCKITWPYQFMRPGKLAQKLHAWIGLKQLKSSKYCLFFVCFALTHQNSENFHSFFLPFGPIQGGRVTHQHGLGFGNLLGKHADELFRCVHSQLGRLAPERLPVFLGDFGGMRPGKLNKPQNPSI